MGMTFLYEIKDEYDLSVTGSTLAQRLHDFSPFHYSRFGDGEFASMLAYRIPSRNYRLDFGGMGIELVRAFDAGAKREGFFIGATSMHARRNQPFIWGYLTHGRIVSASLLYHKHNVEHTRAFLAATRERDCVLVSHGSNRRFAKRVGWRFVTTPPKNSYQAIDRIEADVRAIVKERDVVLYSTGATSCCLIERLHDAQADLTSIDFGHFPDILRGNYTIRRAYRRNRKWAKRYRAALLLALEGGC